MKQLLLTTVCAAGLATGASAATVTFDFVALAAGNEGGIEGSTFSSGGLSVTVTSSANAYLDDLSGGLPGGLGVCQALNASNQCAVAGDDEIGPGESVTLTFSQPISMISGLSFTNGSHLDLNNSSRTFTETYVQLGGSTSANTSFFLAAGSSLPLSFGTSYTLSYGGFDPSDFYLNAATFTFDDPAPIPLPAGLPLLAGALGMLAFARRRSAA